jgi:hypothetical protein
MINYNDIVEIEELVRLFNHSTKKVLKPYFVKSISINEIVIEDINNPSNRKTIHPSIIQTINGMTVSRNAKV